MKYEWTGSEVAVKTEAESYFTPWPDHLALPLRSAGSRLGVGCPDSCRDREVDEEDEVLALNRFSTAHFEQRRFPRALSKSTANVNIFSIKNDFEIRIIVFCLSNEF